MTNVVTLSFFALQLVCGDPGSWRFASEARTLEPGVEELTVVLENAAETVPPEFEIAWSLPQRDIPHFWNVAAGGDCGIPPDWSGDCVSSLTHCAPVYSLFSAANENRLATAADDARRTVRFKAGLREESCTVECSWRFFTEKTVPSRKETVRIRFDTRKVFWSDAVRDASGWIVKSAGYVPLAVPDAARAPLYSAWYSFHQDVHAKDIEEECAVAASLGMKTLIVDDGWQTDDTNRGYDFCGDWEMSKNRFPDMAAHVKRVHALGMKYMIWYSVPFVGVNSKAATAFRGKFLREPRKGAAGILDPRFPEVREHLADLYEKALREWGLDGLKLDFIDSFGSDPGVPEAVDALMTDVARRLKAIKPEVLIEFRQSYIGPAIRTYGNMLRVSDCPGNVDRNRTGTAWLRLTSGDAAVHSDMLEWHPTETAENAARFVLSAIFGTVQYSMMLRRLPKDHLRMLRHWIEFTEAHKPALQLGDFKVPYPQLGVPFLVGEASAERIIGVYCPDLTVDTGAPDRKVFVLNATQRRRLTLRLAKPCEIVAFDTFGHETGRASVKAAGLYDADCPASGYLEIVFGFAGASLQDECQRLADEAVASGEQGGVQFCVYRDGKCIVDVWAGRLSTNENAAAVRGDSLFPIFSTEKPLLATAVHRAVEKGRMDYDRPLCTWWPEFTGDGKERLTLRETLGYRSGMAGGCPDRLSEKGMADWPLLLQVVASDKPEIPPGTKQRYMPYAYAWMLGHPLEVAMGKPLKDVLDEEVLVPAGIADDFYFVADESLYPRIATFYRSGFCEIMNKGWARKAILPSAWAVASARGIARFYNRLCGYDGKPPLIRPGTLEAALKPCRHPSDPLPDAATMKRDWFMIFGMGYGLWGEADRIGRVFGHGGAGGSEGLVDRDRRLIVAYTCNFNNFEGGLRQRLYDAVGMWWRYSKDKDADIQTLQMKTSR